MASFKFATKLSIPRPIVKEQDTKQLQKKAEQAVNKGMLRASTYVQRDLRAALDLALESPQWSWPRETKRQNGSTAGTSRDIIDTGALKKSLKFQEKAVQSKTSLNIVYTAPYAAMVHYGGAVQPYGKPNAATVLIPGRPWIEAILNGTHGFEKFDLKTPYVNAVHEVWKEVMG